MPPTYSLVVPIFNEEAVIPILLRRLDALLEALDAPGEVIVVDDGSDDTSAIVIEAKARADKRYRLIKLSRNFGHQIAITVGLDHAAGQAVIVMDADLQDPPEVVLEMIARWKEGYDVVSAERASRQGESRFKRATADLFYRLIGAARRRRRRRATPATSGWSIAGRSTASSPCPSATGSCAACSPGSGSASGTVTFDRPPRAAGTSKYSLRKMLALAANGLISFSDAPLRLALWAGGAVSALAFIYGLSVIGRWAFGDPSLERGWSSTIVVVAALGGANMLMTGVIGLYVGRIYAEAKGRPLYIVERAVGFDEAPASGRRSAQLSESGSRRPARARARWS